LKKETKTAECTTLMKVIYRRTRTRWIRIRRSL